MSTTLYRMPLDSQANPLEDGIEYCSADGVERVGDVFTFKRMPEGKAKCVTFFRMPGEAQPQISAYIIIGIGTTKPMFCIVWNPITRAIQPIYDPDGGSEIPQPISNYYTNAPFDRWWAAHGSRAATDLYTRELAGCYTGDLNNSSPININMGDCGIFVNTYDGNSCYTNPTSYAWIQPSSGVSYRLTNPNGGTCMRHAWQSFDNGKKRDISQFFPHSMENYEHILNTYNDGVFGGFAYPVLDFAGKYYDNVAVQIALSEMSIGVGYADTTYNGQPALISLWRKNKAFRAAIYVGTDDINNPNTHERDTNLETEMNDLIDYAMGIAAVGKADYVTLDSLYWKYVITRFIDVATVRCLFASPWYSQLNPYGYINIWFRNK